MEDIIKQIVQIDSVALNTKKGNEEALRLKKNNMKKKSQVIDKIRYRELKKEQMKSMSKL